MISALHQLQKKRHLLIQYLTGFRQMALGSVYRVRRKCGNPRCHCNRDRGHPQVLFLFKDDQGQKRCKLVRKADESRMIKAGDNYKQWREVFKQLRTIENRQREILLSLLEERATRYE